MCIGMHTTQHLLVPAAVRGYRAAESCKSCCSRNSFWCDCSSVGGCDGRWWCEFYLCSRITSSKSWRGYPTIAYVGTFPFVKTPWCFQIVHARFFIFSHFVRGFIQCSRRVFCFLAHRDGFPLHPLERVFATIKNCLKVSVTRSLD